MTVISLALRAFILVEVLLLAVSCEEHSGEYCDTEIFKAECQGQDEVILMTSAKYGRMRVGRCVEYHLGHIDCYSDVITMMDRRCSGRKSCQVRIPDAEFESTGPCLKELKTYLEVSYRCIQVHSPQTQSSCSSLVPINLTSSVGFISMTTVTPSSEVSPTSGTCSWWIVGRSGQTINLTLYDFNQNLQSAETPYRDQSRSRPACRQLGWLNDLTPTKKRQVDHQGSDAPNGDIPICAGVKRVTPVYSSRSHSVKLWLDLNPLKQVENYLLEFTVSGCATPTNLPSKSWSKVRDDGALLVGCHGDLTVQEVNNPGEGGKNPRWILKCNGGTWTGYLGNCTDRRSDAGRLNSSEDVVISYGLAIAIGAVIGVLIATGIVLVVGLVRDKTDSSRNSQAGQRSHELHENLTTEHSFHASPPFKRDDLCHQFETSTSLNYERHPLRAAVDVTKNTSKLQLEQTNSQDPQTRYVVRGGPIFCPHHRLHPINSDPAEGSQSPLMEVMQHKGYYSSSRSLSRQGDQWADQGRPVFEQEEYLQTIDPKLMGSIFTVVDSKQQQQQQQRQNCLC